MPKNLWHFYSQKYGNHYYFNFFLNWNFSAQSRAKLDTISRRVKHRWTMLSRAHLVNFITLLRSLSLSQQNNLTSILMPKVVKPVLSLLSSRFWCFWCYTIELRVIFFLVLDIIACSWRSNFLSGFGIVTSVVSDYDYYYWDLVKVI